MLHNSFTGEPVRPSGFGAQALRLLERALRGRDDVFFTLLQQSADTAAAAAELLRQMLAELPENTTILAVQIREMEHRGDRSTHEIIDRLNREVATPIDRKDILELAGALDDITDFIDESSEYLTLYSTEASMLHADAMADVLVDATRELARAVQSAVRFESVTASTAEINRLEHEGDRLVRRGIASLFIDGIDPMVVIRWKDIFERLEDAIDATKRASFVLESIVIRNI